MKKSIAFGLVVLAVSYFLVTPGCATVPPYPTGPYTCETACANQRHMSCELGTSTPEGSTCEDVCHAVMGGPLAIRWDLRCLATAETCSATCL